MISPRLFFPIISSLALLIPTIAATMSNKPFSQGPAVKELKSMIKGDLILPCDGKAYDEAIKRWSKLAVRPAGAVMFPKNEEDISHAVAFAVAHHVEIAIKGAYCFTISVVIFSSPLQEAVTTRQDLRLRTEDSSSIYPNTFTRSK